MLTGFAGHDGLQVFFSDGMSSTCAGCIGTRPGSGAAKNTEITAVGTTGFFAVDDGVLGDELWAYSLSGGGVAFAQRYGQGCHGTGFVVLDIGARGLPQLAVPNDPALAGGVLFGQYAVVDPGGALYGLVSMRDGLQMVLGN